MRTILALASVALVFACTSAEPEPAAKLAPPPAGYTLVLIKTGPKSGQLSDEENQAAFAGHFSNMSRLANEHKLVVAGPYGKQKSDPALRGLFVINSADRAQATEWASTDPTTRAGVFVLEYHDFATAAPLVAALDRSLETEAKAEVEGRKLKPGDGARPYVLLTSEKHDLAQRELAPLLDGGGVFLVAKVDGTRLLALLDAKDTAEARVKFASVLERIGDCALDDWFASDELAHLSDRK